MQKVKMQISELTGSALDYAVDRAVNGKRYSEELSIRRTAGDSFRPSSSWNKSGPLLETWQIFLKPPHDVHKSKVGPNGKRVGEWEIHEGWTAIISARVTTRPSPEPLLFPFGGCYCGQGDTPLQAICRAIASTAGDSIDVPKELFKKAGGAS